MQKQDDKNNELLQIEKIQKQICNPNANIWIGANAGSGKTTAIINRILSLLINNVNANEIVVLTYTTTATMEIMNRLYEKLLLWSKESEEYLTNEFIKLGIELDQKKEKIQIAYGLFKKFLWTSELRISTIHSFAASFLQQYRQDVMINTTTMTNKRIVEKLILTKVLQYLEESKQLHSSGKIIFSDAVESFFCTMKKKHLLRAIRQIINERYDFEKVDFECFLNTFRDHLYLLTYDIVDNTVKSLQEILKQFISENKNAKAATVQGMILQIQAWLELTDQNNIIELEKISTLFLTKQYEIKRSEYLIKLKYFSEIAQIFFDYHRKKNTQILMKSNCTMEEVRKLVISEYKHYIKTYGAIDHDSVLDDLLYFLTQEEAKSDFAKYSFLQNTKHILIDEAQDVSPMQWKIVFALLEGIFKEQDSFPDRKICIVGDEKQSIFSFKGADVKNFANIKNILKNKLKEHMIECSLVRSYRTNQKILDFLNHMLEKDEFIEGVASKDDSGNAHFSAVQTLAGDGVYIVNHEKEEYQIRNLPNGTQYYCASKTQEISSIEDSGKESTEDFHSFYWGKQDDSLLKQKEDVTILLAYRAICDALSEGFKPHEITILLRDRNSKIFQLINICKDNAIPIAIDKFNFTAHVIFYDILSLCKFLLSPECNMHCVTLLRSIFCDYTLSNVETCTIAANKANVCLFSYLQTHDSEKYNRLIHFQQLFYTGGLQHLLWHLLYKEKIADLIRKTYEEEGVRVANICLQIVNSEQDYSYNILGYIEHLLQIDAKVAIDKKDKIQITTIHSAKGTENEVVILLDISQMQKNSDKTSQLLVEDKLMTLVPKLNPVDESLKNKLITIQNNSMNEEKRALYVAMTRAKRRLYIATNSNVETKSDQEIIENAMSWQQSKRKTWGDIIMDIIRQSAIKVKQS